MAQYLLSVHHTPDDPLVELSPEEIQPIFEAVDAFNDKLRAEGAWVFAGGLQPVESATTVDATGADLDVALVWATEGSRACAAKVEVRPFQSE